MEAVQWELWNGAFSPRRAVYVSVNDETAVSSVVRQCEIQLQDVSRCIDDKVDPYYRNIDYCLKMFRQKNQDYSASLFGKNDKTKQS